jgi:hypothetical protein
MDYISSIPLSSLYSPWSSDSIILPLATEKSIASTAWLAQALVSSAEILHYLYPVVVFVYFSLSSFMAYVCEDKHTGGPVQKHRVLRFLSGVVATNVGILVRCLPRT